MTIPRARKILIIASLVITGLQMVFLISAPAFDYPLSFPESLNLLQIISPVFLGYLGSAAHFIFQHPVPTVHAQREYLGMLVIGPLVIYAVSVVVALAAFAYSNRTGVEIGSGMSLENLATTLSLCLGVLAVTTGVITSYLFVTPDRAQGPAAAGNPQGIG